MRKDIQIHINTGDVVLEKKTIGQTYPFSWVEPPIDKEERYIYGEITVPWTITENSILSSGVSTIIPYTPVYKEVRIRIKREYGNDFDKYVTNPADGTEWFVVQASMYGKTQRNIFASELIVLAEEIYHIVFSRGVAVIYSGYETDFNIVNANIQNKNLMLSCVPGNNYRYPITGVGIIRWVNSKIETSRLAEVLSKQFSEDGTPVVDAELNQQTRQLNISLNTSNTE